MPFCQKKIGINSRIPYSVRQRFWLPYFCSQHFQLFSLEGSTVLYHCNAGISSHTPILLNLDFAETGFAQQEFFKACSSPLGPTAWKRFMKRSQTDSGVLHQKAVFSLPYAARESPEAVADVLGKLSLCGKILRRFMLNPLHMIFFSVQEEFLLIELTVLWILLACFAICRNQKWKRTVATRRTLLSEVELVLRSPCEGKRLRWFLSGRGKQRLTQYLFVLGQWLPLHLCTSSNASSLEFR